MKTLRDQTARLTLTALSPRSGSIHIAALALLAATVLAAPASAYNWDNNADYQQRDPVPAHDLEAVLKGNVTAHVHGGHGSLTNPFPDPASSASYDSSSDTTVVSFFSSSGGTIAQDDNKNLHFGIAFDGAGAAPKTISWHWTPTEDALPTSYWAFVYDPTSEDMTVTVLNLSGDTVALSDAGFQLFSSHQPLETLNQTDMPSSSFISVSSLDGAYGPGDFESVVLTNVASTDFIVTFGTLQFAGSSLSNPYGDGTGSIWTEVGPASQVVVPEPSTWAMMLSGFFGLRAVMGWRRRTMVEAAA